MDPTDSDSFDSDRSDFCDDLFCYVWEWFARAVEEGNESECFSLITKYGSNILKCYGPYQNTFAVAAQYGSPELAERLINLGADVNEVYEDDISPLCYAIKNTKTETYKVLLLNGADLNIKYCHPPLEEALYIGSIERIEALVKKPPSENFNEQTEVKRCSEVIEFILDHKTDLKLESREFSMLILFSARLGIEETFELVLNECKKYLLEHGNENKKAINIQGYFGRTALHYAVRSELPKVVKFLLDHGCDVNATTDELYTPLHYAACLENKELIQMLLERGADINCTTSENSRPPYSTPLSLVCGDSELKSLLKLEFFIQYGENITRRMEGLVCHELIYNKELIEFLIKNGAKVLVNRVNVFRSACENGNLDIVKLIIKCNDDFKFQSEWKSNCIYYSALGGNLEVLDFLLSCGADLRKSTIMHKLVSGKKVQNLEIFELLVCYGVDINSLDENFNTVLCKVRNVYFETIECFLRLNADITIRNLENDSVLVRILNDNREMQVPPSIVSVIPYIALKLDQFIDHIEEIKDLDSWKWVHSFFEECKLQVEKMKKTRICKEMRLSFYEFLTFDIYLVTKLTNTEAVLSAFNMDNYWEKFPAFKDYIECQLSRAKSLKKPVEKTKKFLENYWKEKLPTFIIEIILSFLKPIEFKNFERALSVLEKI